MTDPNTPKKITNISEVTQNMNRGSSSNEVKVLQQYLANNGFPEVKPDGVFGPVTEDAVKKFQSQNGLTVDGIVGPQTLGKLSKIATSTETPGKSKQEIEDEYSQGVNKYFPGNSKATLDYAMSSGDFSGIYDQDGKPFSSDIQADALAKSQEALQPGFDAQMSKDTADTEAKLLQDKLDYEKWQNDQGAKFQEDKSALDQNAADKGVLFSGGRTQREKALKNAYDSDQSYKLSSLGNSIGSTARDYQYNYGDKAANKLSNYYSAGSNTYDPNVATGGVKQSGLSNLYNASGLGYQGTKNVANTAAAQQRAAGLLWNKANKLVSTGIKNSYKGY